MKLTLALAPFCFVVGALMIVFGNPKAQQMGVALYWLGLAFTLYEFGGRGPVFALS
jgi:hypothetical protein